ncbi:hypothetical protein NDU88_003454 [Pleurodeles waltl]|uniref:Uncharacterized protein n=1 Tax=Pleurodeles waltl TaxID=8319 RepID=A0AAV7MQM7_PLEWA|nr:hypothetical protein NDU88_003454 [Pleurodeles waltl]
MSSLASPAPVRPDGATAALGWGKTGALRGRTITRAQLLTGGQHTPVLYVRSARPTRLRFLLRCQQRRRWVLRSRRQFVVYRGECATSPRMFVGLRLGR